jgi:hypothetical protein
MSLASDLSDGIGGLRFVATAPPGVGRLCRVPFYLTSAGGDFRALPPGGTVSATSATSPIIATAPVAGGVSASATLTTPQISWATLRIVGFEVAINIGENQSTDDVGELVVQRLKIGGGANLFVHEDYAPANIYASGNDSFSGLRDYPLLKSPNTAEVTVAFFGHSGALTNAPASIQGQAANVNVYTNLSTNILFSCNLVVEILQDDNYGSHIPGPYARKGAMVRKGGSFV